MRVSRSSIQDLLDSKGRQDFGDGQETSDREHEPDEEEYSGYARGRVGTRPQMMLSFRKASGATDAFAYSMLSRLQSEDPSTGFTLKFAGVEVSVVGQNLARLFRYVREHRAVEIVEADRSTVMLEEGEAVVASIQYRS